MILRLPSPAAKRDPVDEAATRRLIERSVSVLDSSLSALDSAVRALTVRLDNLQIFNVRDFGAVGDGVTDDVEAIQHVADMAASVGGVCYFPPGVYRVSAPIHGTAGARNILKGAGRESTVIRHATGGQVLAWDMFAHQASEFGSRLEDLTFDGAGAGSAVVEIVNATLLHMARVSVLGNGLSGTATDITGLRLVSLFDCVFVDVYVSTCGSATRPCVVIDSLSAGGANGNAMNNCQFYGLHIEPGEADATLLQLLGNSVNPITELYFYGLKTHGSFVTFDPATQPVVDLSEYVRGCAFYSHICAYGKGTEQIRCGGQRNVWFNLNLGVGTTPPDYGVRFTTGADSNILYTPNVKNSSSYGVAPFRADALTTHNKILFPQGSNFVPTNPFSDAGRNLILWDDLSLNTGLQLRNSDGFAPSIIVGLSGTSTPARNFRGAVTIADANTSASVAFSAQEADAGYHVVATVMQVSGSPPAGARRVWVSDRSATGFTINVEDAPGPGNAVTIAWVLVR